MTEHAIDRTGWPSGVWDTEPDREEWRAHGFPCLIVRNHFGALCGYVGVPPGHPLHGVPMGADALASCAAHGGITYANACAGGICHVPREGEPADVWWLGFDCGHAFDFSPGQYAALKRLGLARRTGAYRSIGYVRAEVEGLALQLSRVTT